MIKEIKVASPRTGVMPIDSISGNQRASCFPACGGDAGENIFPLSEGESLPHVRG